MKVRSLDLREWIQIWAKNSDDQILAQEGRHFLSTNTGDESLFLRNLLDLSARYAWTSDFGIKAMGTMLPLLRPESKEERNQRRADLERWGF